jgi:signal transduction histidine kinase
MESRFDEDRLNMAEQIAQMGYFEMDIKSEQIFCSNGALKILKLKPNLNFYFSDLINLIHPNDIGRVHRASIQAVNNNSVFRLEFRLGHLADELTHILANGKVKHDDSGKANTVLWSIQDITRQKAYEEAIELSESRLKYAERIANLGNFEWFFKTNQFIISDEIYRILDLDPVEFDSTMSGFLKYVHPNDLSKVERENDSRIKSNDTNTDPITFRVKNLKTGDIKHLYSKGETIVGPDGLAFKRIGILMDITKQVKLEKKLKATDKRRRELISQRERIGAEAIIFGQEDERQRMSMEIHDGLGQILTAVYFNLNHLESLTEAYENKEVEKSLQEVFDLLQKSRTSIRAIANNLMPQVLMKFGLFGAIQALVNELFANTPIEIYLKSPEENIRYEQSQEISIYRIIQELLNNTVKHSKSSEVKLRLSLYKNFINIYLVDNGIGYDLQNAETSHLKSKGVSNIRQRIKFLSGSLTSKIDNGSKVFIQIPLIATS